MEGPVQEVGDMASGEGEREWGRGALESHFTIACVNIGVRDWAMVECPFPVTAGGAASLPTGGAPLSAHWGSPLPAHFILFLSQYQVLSDRLAPNFSPAPTGLWSLLFTSPGPHLTERQL